MENKKIRFKDLSWCGKVAFIGGWISAAIYGLGVVVGFILESLFPY